jgi:hypothetical protein
MNPEDRGCIPPRRYKKIADRQGVSEATISEVCKRYEAGGVTGVLGRKKRSTPPVSAKVTPARWRLTSSLLVAASHRKGRQFGVCR